MYAVSLQKRFKAWAPIRVRRLKIHIKIHFQNPFGNSGKRNNVTVSGTQNRFSPRAPTFNVGAGPKSCALMPNIEGGGRGAGPTIWGPAVCSVVRTYYISITGRRNGD